MRRSRVRFPPRAHSIGNVSSIVNLPRQLQVALREVPSTEPYPRFVIDNVLAESEYQKLLAEFPDHLVGDPGNDGFANFTIQPGAEVTLGLSPAWREFVNHIRSDATRSAMVHASVHAAMRRYPRLWRWMLFFRLRNPRNYEINLAFSANHAGRFLAPHSDNSYKVLALVLYFAPAGYSNAQEGTWFYRAHSKSVIRESVRRFNRFSDSAITRLTPLELLPMTSAHIHSNARSPQEQQAAESWFYENFTNDFNVSFKANRIAGFVKTQDSFHAVDMRDSTYVGPRRSLLINLNLKHSHVARAGQAFRARVLRLSS
jgi:hypothetical protein